MSSNPYKQNPHTSQLLRLLLHFSLFRSFLIISAISYYVFSSPECIYLVKAQRTDMSGQIVKVKRGILEACMTCPLCNKLLKEATTISSCLHTCKFFFSFTLSCVKFCADLGLLWNRLVWLELLFLDLNFSCFPISCLLCLSWPVWMLQFDNSMSRWVLFWFLSVDMECSPNCFCIFYMVWIVVVFQFSENLCIFAFGSCMYGFEFFFFFFYDLLSRSAE